MGACGAGRHIGARSPASGVTTAPRPDSLIGDAERQRRTDLLSRAFAEGMLEVDELEAALEQVLRARTVADLDAGTRLLPEAWLAASRRSDAAAQRAAARQAALRQEARAYVAVIGLLVAIWLVTAVTAGATYFWPIWPALGWGIPLLLGRSPRPTHRPTG